jgi:hypothetical protein
VASPITAKPGRDGGGASAYGRFDGTFGSNGTLKVPFVTTHALEVPVAVTRVPEPLKLRDVADALTSL